EGAPWAPPPPAPGRPGGGGGAEQVARLAGAAGGQPEQAGGVVDRGQRTGDPAGEQIRADLVGPLLRPGGVLLPETRSGPGDQEREQVRRVGDRVRRRVPGLGAGDRRGVIVSEQRTLGQAPQGGCEALEL